MMMHHINLALFLLIHLQLLYMNCCQICHINFHVNLFLYLHVCQIHVGVSRNRGTVVLGSGSLSMLNEFVDGNHVIGARSLLGLRVIADSMVECPKIGALKNTEHRSKFAM